MWFQDITCLQNEMIEINEVVVVWIMNFMFQSNVSCTMSTEQPIAIRELH
jgi:hypothetical protein